MTEARLHGFVFSGVFPFKGLLDLNAITINDQVKLRRSHYRSILTTEKLGKDSSRKGCLCVKTWSHVY